MPAGINLRTCLCFWEHVCLSTAYLFKQRLVLSLQLTDLIDTSQVLSKIKRCFENFSSIFNHPWGGGPRTPATTGVKFFVPLVNSCMPLSNTTVDKTLMLGYHLYVSSSLWLFGQRLYFKCLIWFWILLWVTISCNCCCRRIVWVCLTILWGRRLKG